MVTEKTSLALCGRSSRRLFLHLHFASFSGFTPSVDAVLRIILCLLLFCVLLCPPFVAFSPRLPANSRLSPFSPLSTRSAVSLAYFLPGWRGAPAVTSSGPSCRRSRIVPRLCKTLRRVPRKCCLGVRGPCGVARLADRSSNPLSTSLFIFQFYFFHCVITLPLLNVVTILVEEKFKENSSTIPNQSPNQSSFTLLDIQKLISESEERIKKHVNEKFEILTEKISSLEASVTEIKAVQVAQEADIVSIKKIDSRSTVSHRSF